MCGTRPQNGDNSMKLEKKIQFHCENIDPGFSMRVGKLLDKNPRYNVVTAGGIQTGVLARIKAQPSELPQ